MNKINYIIIAVVFLLLGFVVGEQYTRFAELDWCVKTGTYFLNAKGIDIDINKNAMSMALILYHQKIDRTIAMNFSNVGS